MIHFGTPPRLYRTRLFSRWMKRAGLSDAALCAAAEEMSAGLVDADLGRGLVKQRVRLPGRGKRGGARVVVATNRGDRWFFLYGFAKNERDHLDADELLGLQAVGVYYLRASAQQLQELCDGGELAEICGEG